MIDDVRMVCIADLVQHKAFQVRKKLDGATAARYAQMFKLDGPIASVPILVGHIVAPDRPPRGRPNERLARDCPPGALVLLAGYHRVLACQSIGREEILARIVDTTAREAQWLAAESNMTHGLPLNGAELRAAFHAYLRAGKHRNEDGSRQSLRDMGRLFGKHHQTMHAWMNTPEFRSLYDHYRPEDVRQEYPERESIEVTPEEETLMSVSEALRIARNLSPALSPDQRADLLRELEETAKAVSGATVGDPTGVDKFATHGAV